MNESKQTMCFVGYIDLLGYKAYFERPEANTEEFLTTIEKAIESVYTAIDDNAHTDFFLLRRYGGDSITPIECKPKIRIFSDNILLSIECQNNDIANALILMQLARILGDIQNRFISEHGLYLRGGLAKGMFYINEQLVFGEALLKSIELEHSAVTPRIIIESELIEYFLEKSIIIKEETLENTHLEVEDWLFYYLGLTYKMDEDGLYFLNYLSGLHYEHLSTHRDMLLNNITPNMHNINVICKYLWVMKYHNDVCCARGFEELMISSR